MQSANDPGWLIPERGAPWLHWGFGTRETVLRDEISSVKQVHGAQVVTVTEAGFAGVGDALITATPGILLGIKTADCLPILVADLRNHAVGAVHAGWRGTAQGVIGAAIQEMEQSYGTKASDLLVAMGPAIGKCCFEVGPEVAREFADFDARLADTQEKHHLDLQDINARQLQKAGVMPENVLRNGLCTMCSKGITENRFWSFRREKEKSGRMWSVVGVKS